MEFESKNESYITDFGNYGDALGLSGMDYHHGSPFTIQTMDGSYDSYMPEMSNDYSYSSESNCSPARPFTPTLPLTASPDMYAVTVAEDSSRRHGSPSYAASIPRSQRFNPMATTATRALAAVSRPAAPKRRPTRQEDSDDDEDYEAPAANASTDVTDIKEKRVTIRRQRIESEQRRRDELREGFSRLKQALPPSNQKASKVSLLDRSTTHIRFLEVSSSQLQARLAAAEAEVQRLRGVNEALMLSTAERHKRSAF